MSGALGQSVQRLVEEDLACEIERATIRHQPTMVKHVLISSLDQKRNQRHVISNNVKVRKNIIVDTKNIVFIQELMSFTEFITLY